MNKLIKFLSLYLLIFSFFSVQIYAQPNEFAGNINSWSTTDMTDRGNVMSIRYQAGSDNANSGFKFRADGTWNPQWCGSDANYTRSLNSLLSGAAYYATGSGGWEHNLEFSATQDNYYTFIVGKNTASNNDMSILETTYNPRTISSVSRTPLTPGNGQSVTVTATLSGTLNTGEYAFIRYSTDAWTSSSLVSMSHDSGDDYTGTIPSQSVGTTVSYYVLTSNDNTFSASDADYFTLELDNNSGGNYSYTVATLYTTAQDGDWNTNSTWTAGSVPPADALTQINHDITINGSVANNPATIEITSGNSITFGASGDITVNSSITNDGTIDMSSGGILSFADGASFSNNSTFTGGTGKITFNGAGTVSGSITFNDAEIQGAVDFGGSASLDGTLTINGGYLNNNSITYNTGSILKYAANYSVNSGDKSWYSNVSSTGSAQEGIPWNVQIPSGVSVTLNDSYQFDINGNIIIDGSFTLGTDGGTHWGDLGLRGDFILNSGASFSNNSRSVKFIGSALQDISGTQAPTFAYVEINNSTGVSLSQNITVNSGFTFTNGKMTIGDYDVTLGTASVSGNASDKYFITNGTGFLIRNVGSSEVAFPVGSASYYAPAYLTQAGTQENLYIKVKEGFDNTTNDDDFTVNLQWTIDEQTAGSNNITTKFQWNETDENTYFDRNGHVKIGRYITGSYSSSAATVAGSGPYTASATSMSDDISSEIPFIVGNTMAFTSSGYKTAQNGNWATGSTWVGGSVPPANAVCAILHHVTVNSTLNDADEVTIYTDKSVTFIASGDLTVNGTFTNNGMLKTNDASASVTVNGFLTNSSDASLNMTGGGILTITDGSAFNNDGTFTAGIGTVEFAGAGTATGSFTFNNLNIKGSVDLGANATLNNTLTLSSSGDLTNNSITYSEGSLLVFDRDYSLANDKLWYRNTASTGSAQEGIPWDVKINASRTLDYNAGDNFYRAMNGDLTINGTFSLSTTSGGDFKIRGDFDNNGTFNNNNRFIEFNGTVSQTINANTTFYDVIINNNANVNLGNSITVSNNLNFTTGKLIIGDYDLTVSGSVLNSNSSKYVVTDGTGYLILNVGTSETTFPVGTSTGYRPAYLTKATTAEDFSVRVQNSIENTVNDPTRIVNMEWTINEATANGDDVTVKLQWNSSDEASNFNRTTNLEMAFYNSGYNNATASLAGTDPYTASRTITGSSVAISNMPFIVANNAAFNASVYVTDTDGDWSTATNWLGDVVPPNDAEVVIKNATTLSQNVTADAISIESGASLSCNSYNITLNDGGAISNNGTFNAGTGTVSFSGSGSISTGSIVFNDVDINGAVNFGSNTTVDGTLTLNAGGSINVNAPVYNSNSTLKYNQGGNITRGAEWQYNIDETDPGYPNNVVITNSTTLDVDGDNNDDNYYQTRFLKGNLTINSGSEISLGDMGGGTSENQICGVYAKGNIVNNGTISLSSNYGGDMMLEGDITNSGTINWNSRAIFFTGQAGNNQNITGISQIPFVLITNGSTVVLNNDLEVNGSGTEFITFARPSSTETGKINLQTYTLSCNGDGNIELNNIAGAEVNGTGRVEVSSGDATFSGTGSGTLDFGSDVTLAINGGTMTFPSTLGIVTIFGTLEVGDGATITNIPTYGNNSTLHYKKGGSFTMGVEWGEGSNIAENIPFNVTVSEGSSASVLNMNDNRHALGELLIENNATLEVAAGTGQLTVNNLTVNSGGKILLKSPNDNGAAGSLITTGTVTNNGTMQAERYVPAFKYTFLSPPNIVTNSQLFTNNPNGMFNPNLYYYNQSYDALTDPDGATYSYWEDDTYSYEDAWVEAHDGEGGSGLTLNTPARGYAYYNDINRKFVFDGTFTTGDQTVTITYDDNDNSQSGVNGYFDGWNLIANPFPSGLDWEHSSWDKTNVDGTIYFWDGTSSNEGNYKYYNSSSYDDGTNVVNGGTQYIPASQAFFIKAKDDGIPGNGSSDSYSLTIPNNARVHSAEDFWAKNNSKNKKSKTSNAFIRLKIKANNTQDELVARYIDEGTENYDEDFDALKIYSKSENVPQIYSYNINEGPGYAINSLPVTSLNETLPIGVEIRKNGQSQCEIELTEYVSNNYHIYFQDTENAHIQNLLTSAKYSFIIYDSIDIRNRFFINYEENTPPQSTNIENYEVDFGNVVNYTIPDNAFTDNNLGDYLSIKASLSNNEPLPDWLFFNNQTLTFSGMPQQAETLEIKITATDLFGQSVSEEFQIIINPVLAEVQTDEVIQVMAENALVRGLLISAGGVNIDNVGICWSTSENPTIDDDFSYAVLDSNSFTGLADNLEPNTNYFVRAFATNIVGTQYGNQLSFLTNPLKVDQIGENKIYIYPNPAKDVLYLNNTDNKKYKYKISDVNGRIILKGKIKSNNINYALSVKNLKSGLYLIEFINTFEKIELKFIKY